MNTASYINIISLALIVIGSSLWGSFTERREQYEEPHLEVRVTELPLWKGTKQDRALTSQV